MVLWSVHLWRDATSRPRLGVACCFPSSLLPSSSTSVSMLAMLKPSKVTPSALPPLTERRVEVEAHEPLAAAKGKRRLSTAITAFRSRPASLAQPKLDKTSRRARILQQQDNEAAHAVLAVILGSSPAPTATAKEAISTTELKKLKSKLLRPEEARRIVGELKRIDAHEHTIARGVCVECDEAPKKDTPATSTFQLLSYLPSLGGALGQAGVQMGAFDALATTSGRLVATSSAHSSFTPPVDRMSALLTWWGYEIAVPPPALAKLAQAHNVSTAAFGFLTALVLGGAPELAPFVRYASAFTECVRLRLVTSLGQRGL